MRVIIIPDKIIPNNLQSLSCLDVEKNLCSGPRCRWNKEINGGTCVPSAIMMEADCMKQNMYGCSKPCKWYGNIKSGMCKNTYYNDKDLALEYNIVKHEIIKFDKFKKILNTRSKTIVYSITERINELNKNLKFLMEKEKKIDIKSNKLKEQDFEKNMQKLKVIKEEEFKLNREKIKLQLILKNLK